MSNYWKMRPREYIGAEHEVALQRDEARQMLKSAEEEKLRIRLFFREECTRRQEAEDILYLVAEEPPGENDFGLCEWCKEEVPSTLNPFDHHRECPHRLAAEHMEKYEEGYKPSKTRH